MPRSQELSSGVTANEVRAICGDILDWKVAAIEALNPTPGDVAVAVGWAGGADDLGERGHALEGLAAQVYDVLTANEEYGEER
jgi:hypothetical protein